MIRFIIALFILFPLVTMAENLALTSFASNEGGLAIAILPFTNDSGETIVKDKPWEIIAADLDFSPRFSAFKLETADSTKFKENGIALFINGNYKVVGDTIDLEVFLYDASTSELVVGKKFHFAKKSSRAIAHRFSNILVDQLYSEKGPFTSKILFTRRNGNNKDIWIMDYDGHNSKKITKGGLNIMPAFIGSSDFVWVSFKRGKPDIYTGSLKNGKNRALIYSRKVETSPEYSSITGKIVYSSSTSGNMEIYTVNRDGSDKKKVTNSTAIDASPTWAPNGASIAFISDRSGAPQLYTMDPDGGNVVRLTFRGRYHDAPSWSPDGKTIAFTSQRDGKFDIYTITIDGKTEQLVSGLAPGSNRYPVWSPDGSHILFVSTRGGRSNLYSVSIDGKVVKQITNDGKSEMPDWSTISN